MDRLLDALPIVIMFESFAAAVPLAIGGRWGSALYWFAAGVLNASVIFGIKRFG